MRDHQYIFLGGFVMSFVDAVKAVFNKYADFKGRARRSEYWYFVLFSGVVSAILGAIPKAGPFLSAIFSLAILVPSLAVSWRRMHDIGKSGAYYLIALIPIVGAIIVIIWCAKDSVPGANQYGENPKGVNPNGYVQ